MPKKKLTKKQVDRKLDMLINASYDLILDRMAHSNTFVPISMPKLFELNKQVRAASIRLMKK